MNIQTLNIGAVFGVQAGLWFFYPWWIALLSLPAAIFIAAALGFLLIPLLSKIVNTELWEHHKAFSPALFFGAGQIASAYLLSCFFL